MSIKNFSRRLERLESHLTPATTQMLEVLIIAAATGEVIERILTPWGDPNHGRRKQRWPQDAGQRSLNCWVENLMATSRPSLESVARYTSPMPPSPNLA